jgi:hypothetical protein
MPGSWFKTTGTPNKFSVDIQIHVNRECVAFFLIQQIEVSAASQAANLCYEREELDLLIRKRRHSVIQHIPLQILYMFLI